MWDTEFWNREMIIVEILVKFEEKTSLVNNIVPVLN